MTDTAPTDNDTPTVPVLRIRSKELFGARREVQIEHRGETYRLRVTRQGKLILTK